MSFIRTAAHARNTAPSFVTLTQLEVVKLRQLPGWARWLYLELKGMSTFKTGQVKTSYAQLVALMDCDQPPTGGKRLEAPTLKQIRTALEWLHDMGLGVRDKQRNEGRGELEIFVRPSTRPTMPTAQKGRGKGRAKNAQNTDEQRESASNPQPEGQGLGQVYQESTPYKEPPVDNLATGRAKEAVKAQLAKWKRAAPPRRKAPPGGPIAAPTGHAPRNGLAHVGDLFGSLGDSHQAPQGGQEGAPTGHAPPVAKRYGKEGGDS